MPETSRAIKGLTEVQISLRRLEFIIVATVNNTRIRTHSYLLDWTFFDAGRFCPQKREGSIPTQLKITAERFDNYNNLKTYI